MNEAKPWLARGHSGDGSCSWSEHQETLLSSLAGVKVAERRHLWLQLASGAWYALLHHLYYQGLSEAKGREWNCCGQKVPLGVYYGT